jgi:phage terminase large subunit-like protein
MPFEFARRNFTAAARDGLDAVLLWPSAEAPSPRPWPAAELVTRLAPAARAGLTACGVTAAEADDALAVVVERVRSGRTGAGWQRAALGAFEAAGATRRRALAEMTEAYLDRSTSGLPVHEWNLPG